MKKILSFAAILIMMPALLFSQINGDPMKSDTINKMDPMNQKTGYWVEKIIDQYAKGYYLNNKKTGTWITTLQNDMIQKLENYTDGIKNGISIVIDKKGHLISQEFYKNGELDGLSIHFNGYSEMPSSEINYRKGKKNGLSRTYYDNGKIQEESTYKEDIKTGTTKWFNKSGKRVAEYNYVNGLFQGLQTTFYDSDTIQSTTEYSNNIQNGQYREYYRNGIMKLQGEYVNGTKEGPWIDYDELGKAVKTTRYKNGIAK
jgi:antitoxin component YwqK of YwqJK toxin-antitoxin module